jgi:nucleoside diphosphate kinase
MKSRTGGILSRLLSRTDLEMVGVQIITPSKELTDAYADSLLKGAGERDKASGKLLSDYVRENFAPMPDGRRERIMMLCFKGEDATKKLYSVVGQLPNSPRRKETLTGETIRDTYCDLVFGRDGNLVYFEPAVLAPSKPDLAMERLKLFVDFAETQPNIAENIVKSDDANERTLVIIKPDNWRRPSTKPGSIIDIFSRTSLRIVGCKLYQMSVAEALEFYGPVRDVLRSKLAPNIAKKAKAILVDQLGTKFSDAIDAKLTESVGLEFADDQFNQIVEFMSGCRPDATPKEELEKPGKVKCMVLVYEGKNAVEKIRNVLGPTDPTKAPPGTIRREFGHDVMVNSAHASDSVASFERESSIIKASRNPMVGLIKEYLKSKGA